MQLDIYKYKSLASTNDKANELISRNELSKPSIVICSEQKNGRGQQGNYWESAPYKNLTFSLVLFPDTLEPSLQFYISKVVALALTDYLAGECDDVSIKWPNDIYVRQKKIAGTLIENTIKGNQISHSIVGIGLNLNQSEFLSNAPNPVSLRQITNKIYDIDTVLFAILKNLENRLTQLNSDRKSIDNQYLAQLFGFGQIRKFNSRSKDFYGRIVGVEENGLLCLEDDSGQKKHFAFKEVSYVF